MDFENKETPQQEGSFDDVLGAPLVEEEIGPDEHAVASAGLIHPDDMELEMIMAEHRPQEDEEASLFEAHAEYPEAENPSQEETDGEEEPVDEVAEEIPFAVDEDIISEETEDVPEEIPFAVDEDMIASVGHKDAAVTQWIDIDAYQ